MSEADVKASPKPSVLLVDDDERLRTRMVRAFEERGYEASVAELLTPDANSRKWRFSKIILKKN